VKRALIIVLDGVGIGAAPDAAAYGDVGSDTLGNLSRKLGRLDLPNLEAFGLGRIAPLEGVDPVQKPKGAWGLMHPASAGKDSTTGHWEIAGVHLTQAFPTYPKGFPPDVVTEFEKRSGRKVIGNVVGSGTAVIERFGEEHQRTGAWILYTSADSVFQLAAHEETIPLEEQYRGCAIAREMLVAPHDVSRVIARPFLGKPGSYARTANRRDFSIQPPAETLLDALERDGIARAGVGKVDDLFAGRAITSRHTANNAEGIAAIRSWINSRSDGLLFVNLVDFDQLFGHRNDAPGFYRALQEFDQALPTLIDALREDDLLFLTADHGNDPTTSSSDHARENVPLLAIGERVRAADLGRRKTFSDLGATVAEWLGTSFRGRGLSFLSAIT
jgi:phosphopentomutase